VDDSGNIFVADDSTNTVSEIPAGGGTPVAVGTGFKDPQGLAVDAAGNLFVADTGNNQIVEVPIAAGVLNTAGQTVLASANSTPAINAPLGLAVDLAGDVLVANSGAGDVLELPNQGGVFGTLSPFAISSGFQKPTAIAVDAAGNIFVGDATAGKIFEIAPTGAQTAVLSNFSQIAGLAVDANDDVFLTQTGMTEVTKVSYTSGSYATNSTVSLGVGLVGPQGIALDSAGDLYVADPAGGAAYEIQRTLGALTFGKVNVGESSAAESLLLADGGNQPLTFGATPFTVSGDSGDFSVTASSSNGCATSLATGTSCGVSVTFSPTASGQRTATVAFQSNATNAATVGATLSGVGANSAPTTLSLSASPSGTVPFGQTVTVTATVTPQMASTATPSGNVQFIVDGNPYGNPVQLAANGTASEPLTGLSGGSHTIDATYSGDNAFASSAATTPLTLNIATAATATTLTATVNGTTAVPTGSSVTFTATVMPTGFSAPPYPSGTVSFYQAGSSTPLNTTPAPLTDGVATFTTTTLPNGQYNVVATYSGDTDFAMSSSAGYAVYVSPPTFLVSNTPATITAPATGSGSATFTLTPIAGYTGTVYLACSGLPKDAVCNFTPGGVDFAVTPGPQNVILTVNTGVAPAITASILFPSLLALAGLVFFRRKHSMPRGLMVALVLVAAAASTLGLTGCGSGTNYASPGGSSTVTVTMTGTPGVTDNISQSFTFNLQVQ
jgi:sugar lactone lactonase YvrE